MITIHPTCKSTDEILHMINSARYYPSLTASICYGGFKYLSEYKLVKHSMGLIGEIRVCNVIINCQNIAQATFNVSALNWLIDRDLGAGVLNRFGSAIISLMLNLFENKKVVKFFLFFSDYF